MSLDSPGWLLHLKECKLKTASHHLPVWQLPTLGGSRAHVYARHHKQKQTLRNLINPLEYSEVFFNPRRDSEAKLALITHAGVVCVWAVPRSLSLLAECDTCQRAAAPAEVATLRDTPPPAPRGLENSSRQLLTQALLAVNL